MSLAQLQEALVEAEEVMNSEFEPDEKGKEKLINLSRLLFNNSTALITSATSLMYLTNLVRKKTPNILNEHSSLSKAIDNCLSDLKAEFLDGKDEEIDRIFMVMCELITAFKMGPNGTDFAITLLNNSIKKEVHVSAAVRHCAAMYYAESLESGREDNMEDIPPFLISYLKKFCDDELPIDFSSHVVAKKINIGEGELDKSKIEAEMPIAVKPNNTLH